MASDRHAQLQAQSEHRLHHRRPPVDGVPLHSQSTGTAQAYDGAINAVGVDVGFSSGGVLAWAVFARTLGAPVGALAGEYVGVSSDVDIGIGGGANILIGGSGRTFALQPVSFEGSIGLNVSLGVSALKLRPVR
jgi:hypothetical protein